MAIPFLTARWSNLAIITYDVDPHQLAPHMPPGCIADTLDGRAFVSLVAFDFLDTRVLGVKWPGFVNFPEINLRFYVRGPDARRGVAFVCELVPQRLVAWLARKIYNEPYLAVPMQSRIESTEAGTLVTHHTCAFAGRAHTIRVRAATATHQPAPDSREHFFKEHSWGFGKTRDGRLISYEVRHPVWRVYGEPVVETLDWDFGAIYGDTWAFLRQRSPCSLVFAVGSEVAVFPKGSALQ